MLERVTTYGAGPCCEFVRETGDKGWNCITCYQWFEDLIDVENHSIFFKVKNQKGIKIDANTKTVTVVHQFPRNFGVTVETTKYLNKDLISYPRYNTPFTEDNTLNTAKLFNYTFRDILYVHPLSDNDEEKFQTCLNNIKQNIVFFDHKDLIEE